MSCINHSSSPVFDQSQETSRGQWWDPDVTRVGSCHHQHLQGTPQKSLRPGQSESCSGLFTLEGPLCSSPVIFLPGWREMSFLPEREKKKTSESRRHTFPELKLCPFLDHVLGKQVLAFPSEWTKFASRAEGVFRLGLLSLGWHRSLEPRAGSYSQERTCWQCSVEQHPVFGWAWGLQYPFKSTWSSSQCGQEPREAGKGVGRKPVAWEFWTWTWPSSSRFLWGT